MPRMKNKSKVKFLQLDKALNQAMPYASKLVKDFCSIDTTNPPGRNYKKCVDFLAKHLRQIGLKVTIHKVEAQEFKRAGLSAKDSKSYPRYNLIARWDVGAKKTLHMNGHYDVVPASSNWKTPPFKPVQKGDKLIGRGTGDMKGADSAAITALKLLKESGQIPPWNIELSLTADEETGGALGAGWLSRKKITKPDAVLVLEGGSGDSLGVAHKGVLWTSFEVLGKSCHASRPHLGVNALEKAAVLIESLNALKKTYTQNSKYMVKPIGKPSKDLRKASHVIGGEIESVEKGKVNTVPDRFSFSMDRRFLPEESIAVVRASIKKAVSAAKRKDRDLKVKVSELLYIPSASTDPNSEICQVAKKAYRSLNNKNFKMRMSTGFTDMHYFSETLGIPTIMYGPEGDGFHSDFEYMSMKSFKETVLFYAELILSLEPH